MSIKPISAIGYASILFLAVLFGPNSAHSQRPAPPPCGPNHTIPAGYNECKDSDGRTWVAPPPASGRGVVVDPPPPRSSGTDVPAPRATGTGSRTTWLTVAGVGALAGLITAIAALVGAFRKG
jgi:hypothetical protein